MKERMDKVLHSALYPSPISQGVKFQCTDCGFCCSGAPGKVRVSETEIAKISKFRNMSGKEFRASETRMIQGEVLLREKPNGDCTFFVNNRCQIHPVKPRQCRTYPFWFSNVRSEAAWAKTCKECPGIGEGEYFSADQIIGIVQEELDRASPGPVD